MMKKIMISTLILSVLFLSACQQEYLCYTGTVVTDQSQCEVCGDGICEGQEWGCNCLADCGPDPGRVRTSCSDKAPRWEPKTGACVAVLKDNCF